jgi:hypothetical protein
VIFVTGTDNLVEVSVSDLKGILPEITDALNRSGIWSAGDLLRIPASRTMKIVGDLAGWQEVRTWHTTASLLELRGMTLPWAEAAAGLKVYTVSDLLDKSLDDMRDLFTKAEKKGLVDSIPSDTEVCEMLKDAALLACSGTVMATVLDNEGNRVQGASVSAGIPAGTTDQRGRVRISRIPLSGPAVLTISADGFLPRSVRLDTVPAYGVTVVRKYSLTPSDGPPEAAKKLSELAGDRLPLMRGGVPVTSHVHTGTVPEGEWVRVISFTNKNKTARVVSPLLSFNKGKFDVSVYKVPLSQLDAGTNVGDVFRMRGGVLTKIRFSPEKLRAYKQLLAIRKSFPRNIASMTDNERADLMTGYITMLLAPVTAKPDEGGDQ